MDTALKKTPHYRAEIIERVVDLNRNVKELGNDLTFINIREKDRTKHVHRLHPYLGKFIPQLVELFLSKFFEKGQKILDPFVGSGTTLIEANLLGLNSVGVELSYFNYLICKVKTDKYELKRLHREVLDCLEATKIFSQSYLQNSRGLFEESTSFSTDSEYLRTWFSERTLAELLFYRNRIRTAGYKYEDVLKVILSRSARSSRLISHYDLARPKEPVRDRYWCIKHRRHCDPIKEALKFINRYSYDTLERIGSFTALRSNTKMELVLGDARYVELPAGSKRLDGIFTSPPYVGVIDYHDQHRYAYELLGIPRQDKLEIGPMSNGQGKAAREQYIEDIIHVFANFNDHLKKNSKVFIVANDRYDLYPRVARALCWDIVDIFSRPVLMRTERDSTQYFESVYYMRKI